MKRGKKVLINILLITIIVLGAAVLLYPAVSNGYNMWQQQKLISTYQKDVNELPESYIEEEWQKAEAYNESLAGVPVRDPFVPGSGMALPDTYPDVLKINGIMGYIDIPCIDVHLPIYHGTSEAVLNKGVGHIEGTALPIGGEGANPVLSAHTGMPQAKLFNDLIKMETGDIFSLRILNRTLYYKVDAIQVILPDETKDLLAVSGKDYVTLLTCTPYGVNSHRLVVRGERCDDMADNPMPDQESSELWPIVLAGAGLLFLLLLWIVVWRRLQKGKGKRQQRSAVPWSRKI